MMVRLSFPPFLPKKRGTSIDIQTSYVLPLAFNIINDEQEKKKPIKNLLGNHYDGRIQLIVASYVHLIR